MTKCKMCVRSVNGRELCSECTQFSNNYSYTEVTRKVNKELRDFLADRDEIYFAYSGGLDSTIALYKILEMIDRDKKEIYVFTANKGIEGEATFDNIKRVLEYFDLSDNHTYLDITDKPAGEFIENKFDEKMTVIEFYRKCFKEEMLPCGMMCNSIMNYALESFMSGVDDYILTGGDTPKKDENGNFSLFSQFFPGSDVKTVRVCAAFDIDKERSRKILFEEGIPWVEPKYGGYDTDCLMPGAIFRKLMEKKGLSDKELVSKYPVIIDYFSERVRFGKIKRKRALESLDNIDYNDSASFAELKEKLELS